MLLSFLGFAGLFQADIFFARALLPVVGEAHSEEDDGVIRWVRFHYEEGSTRLKA